MNWINTESRAVVNAVMNIQFQKCGKFLDTLRTCWFLKQPATAWHCINTTVHTVRLQKAVPCRTDSSAFLPFTGSPAMFLQSTFPSPVRSVPSVNIPLSSPLCSSCQHSPLHYALFLQSIFRSPVRSVPPVNIPLSSPLCSFSQHSPLQSALFLQSTFPSPVRCVSSVNIPLSSPLCSSSQHSALQSALLRHIKPMTLSVPRSYKHRPSSLHQSRTVTSLAFYCEGLWSTPSRLMYEPWCRSSSTKCLQRTGLNFTLHLLCLCVSAVSSCWSSVQTVR